MPEAAAVPAPAPEVIADPKAQAAPPAAGAAAESTGAPAGAAAGASAEPPAASPVTPSADDIAAARLQKIARAAHKVRLDASRNKDAFSEADVSRAFKSLAPTDPMEALRKTGQDPHDFYNRLTDAIMKDVKGKDPDAVIAEKVQQRLDEAEKTRATELETKIQTAWVGNTRAALTRAEYPTLVESIAQGKLSLDDLYTAAKAEHAAGRPSDPARVLQIIEAAIAPPPPPAPAPKPVVPNPAAGKGAATVKDEPDDDKLSFSERMAKAKAKLQIK